MLVRAIVLLRLRKSGLQSLTYFFPAQQKSKGYHSVERSVRNQHLCDLFVAFPSALLPFCSKPMHSCTMRCLSVYSISFITVPFMRSTKRVVGSSGFGRIHIFVSCDSVHLCHFGQLRSYFLFFLYWIHIMIKQQGLRDHDQDTERYEKVVRIFMPTKHTHNLLHVHYYSINMMYSQYRYWFACTQFLACMYTCAYACACMCRQRIRTCMYACACLYSIRTCMF